MTRAWAAFLAAYILSNRGVAIPVGIAVGLGPGPVAATCLLLDLLQIPIYTVIFRKGWRIIGLDPDVPTRRGGRVLSWARSARGPGVLTVAALPTFGGGIWTAVLFAEGFGMGPREKILWIGLGSAAGIAAVLGIFGAIVTFVGALLQ